jgi:hypothetical protein
LDPVAAVLELSGYPATPSSPASWRWVEGSIELACCWIAAVGQQLREAMAVVGRDVLHLVWVSLKERKNFT